MRRLRAVSDDGRRAGAAGAVCRPPRAPRSRRSGSPLSGPATYNTTENLNYRGTDTSLPPGPELPLGGSIHTYHFGADTAIWNTALEQRHAGGAQPKARPSRSSSRDAPNRRRRPGAADADPPAGHHAASGREREGGPHLTAVRRPGLRAERRQRLDGHAPTTRSTCAWSRATTSTSTTRAGSSKSTTAAASPTACSARRRDPRRTPSSRAVARTTATPCRAANARPWKALPPSRTPN